MMVMSASKAVTVVVVTAVHAVGYRRKLGADGVSERHIIE